MTVGYRKSEEHKQKLRLAGLGKKQSPETIAKRVAKLRGQKRSEEIRKKFCAIQRTKVQERMEKLGYNIPPEQRERIRRTLTGRKLPPEHIEKLKIALKGRCTPPPEHFEKLSKLYKGKPFSGKTFDHTGRKQSFDERRRRSNTCRKGEKHHSWNGGTSKHWRNRHHTVEYKIWRDSVFQRDDYTCQRCFERGGYLTAHHIKSYAKFPELRFDIENGVTYCGPCHAAVDKQYRLFRPNGQEPIHIRRKHGLDKSNNQPLKDSELPESERLIRA